MSEYFEEDLLIGITAEEMEDELTHYGMPRRSGRYPWGSGKENYQRTHDFLSRIDELKEKGLTEAQIAETIGLTTTQLRVQASLAKSERRHELVETAVGLREKGYSLNEIASKMGYSNDSSVRSLLNETSCQRMNEAQRVADTLRKKIDEKGMIDVGIGVERELGCSKEKLAQALYILEREGYPTYSGRMEQVTNKGKFTTMTVLCPPGTEYKEIYKPEKIHSIKNYNTETGEMDCDRFIYPRSLDINRVKVRYAEEGGVTKDGTIEIRRGCPDLDLGGSHYSQVRILVDKDRYMKGMAVYKDDDNFPPGVDVIFNTNKSKDKSPREVFKEIKNDPDNPFGSTIKSDGQSYYIDKDGKRKLSYINKRADEGDWENWSKGLPSQFLSKQKKALIQKQLALTKADKLAEYDEIMAIPNPTVRKKLLQSFAEDCDAAAVHLKAAALPRQRYQVILPIDSLKDNEVYAPNFKPGEQIALIRFPHGGTFEIPILTVNNKNKDAIKMIGNNPMDAICVNSKVAERLSGADFDGDTALCIPTGKGVNITSKPALKGLETFDNKREYPATPNSVKMKKENVGKEMGIISNLITDMTLKGANDEELTRAVKHSMVVIDAYKHKLDYKKSEKDNGIAALKKKYQTTIDADGKVHVGGASTLLSKAKGQERVDKRIGSPKINQKGKAWYDPNEPEGALIYKTAKKNVKGKPYYDPTKPEGSTLYLTSRETGEIEYTDSKGRTKYRQQVSTKMMEAKDARSLSSGNPKEELYADYANSMKALANRARKSIVTAGNLKHSPEAKKQYKPEYDSLMHKLNIALKNAPRERQAQLIANSVVNAKKQAHPELEGEDLKKIKNSALQNARKKVGASRELIKIEDREWEAIEKGAISENTLMKILNNADMDSVRAKATPKQTKTLSAAKINKLNCMLATGYSNAEIAESLGVSISTIAEYLKKR